MVGDFPLSVRQVLGAVFGDGGKDAEFIVGTLRLPRALTGMMVGAALGMSGAAAGAVVVITMFDAWNTQVAVAGGLLTAVMGAPYLLWLLSSKARTGVL
jgi:ABC-type enterobactin transport system permease subunit